jgi:hypothetical protein
MLLKSILAEKFKEQLMVEYNLPLIFDCVLYMRTFEKKVRF